MNRNARATIGVCAILLLAASAGACKKSKPTPADESGEQIPVPSDPKAKYFVIDQGFDGDRPTLTTRRVGPSGTSYAKRLFDCAARTWMYLGEGESLKKLEGSKPETKMGPLVQGSIADVLWTFSCAQYRANEMLEMEQETEAATKRIEEASDQMTTLNKDLDALDRELEDAMSAIDNAKTKQEIEDAKTRVNAVREQKRALRARQEKVEACVKDPHACESAEP